jgi:hypothetical protein
MDLPPLPAPAPHPTLLSLALSYIPAKEHKDFIAQLDWSMPDVGRAYTVMYGNQWGAELIQVHPLSTLARLVDEDTFRLALSQAAAAQQGNIMVRSGGREEAVDLSDWVATGVVSAVARHGTTGMLKDLVEHIRQRSRQNSDLGRPNAYERLPDPFAAMALGTTDYARKIKLLVGLAQAQSADLFASPRSAFARRLGQRIRDSFSSQALSRAITAGNQPMVEAVVGAGHASMGLETFVDAASARQLSLAVFAANALGWQNVTSRCTKEKQEQGWSYMMRELCSHAWLCFERITPGTQAFADKDRLAHSLKKEFDPHTELLAAGQVASLFITQLRATISQEKDASKLADEVLHLVTPGLMALPAEALPEVWSDLQEMWGTPLPTGYQLPGFACWSNMAHHADRPWVQHLCQVVEQLSHEEATSFLAAQQSSLARHCSQASPHDLEAGQAAGLLPGVALWWSHLPATARPASQEAWMDEMVSSCKPEQALVVRRVMLETAARQVAPPSRPQVRTRSM